MSKRHLDIWRDLGITLRFLFKLSRINLCRFERHNLCQFNRHKFLLFWQRILSQQFCKLRRRVSVIKFNHSISSIFL